MWWMLNMAVAQVTDFDADVDVDLSGRALAALGLAPTQVAGVSNPGRIVLGASLEAEFGAYVECGAIKFDGDFNAVLPDVSDVPQQLAQAGTAVLSALPMLTVCHTSPSLCAELKNLNFRIDEQWDFQADLCKSMNGYIDDQAEKGEKESRARHVNRCVQELSGPEVPEAQRMDLAAAQRTCMDQDEPYLAVDIAQGFITNAVSHQPQKILKQALAATQTELSQNENFYEWLTAIGGEMELRHNGQIIPLFPPSGNLLAEDLIENMETSGYRIAISTQLKDIVAQKDGGKRAQYGGQNDPLDDRDPLAYAHVTGFAPNIDEAADYWMNALTKVFRHDFSVDDYDNLHTLDTSMTYSMARLWGKVASKVAIQNLRTEMESELAIMEKNPALPDAGKGQIKTIRRTLKVVADHFEDEEIPTVAEFRLLLLESADSIRRRDQATAAALATGEERNRKVQGDGPGCVSFITCGGQ